MTSVVADPPAAYHAQHALLAYLGAQVVPLVGEAVGIHGAGQPPVVEELGHLLALVGEGPIGQGVVIVDLPALLQAPVAAQVLGQALVVQAQRVALLALGGRRMQFVYGVDGVEVILGGGYLGAAYLEPLVIADVRRIVRQVHQIAKRAGQVVVVAVLISIHAHVLAQARAQVGAVGDVVVELHCLALADELLTRRGRCAAYNIRIFARRQHQVQRLFSVAISRLILIIDIEVLEQILLHTCYADLLLFEFGPVVARHEYGKAQRIRRHIPAKHILLCKAHSHRAHHCNSTKQSQPSFGHFETSFNIMLPTRRTIGQQKHIL